MDDELTWMMLKEKLAKPDADIFGEDTGGFQPMGDAVRSILAAASEDEGDYGFGSFFGDLTDPVERQQYFATLAQAASQAPDAGARNRIYDAAKQYQTGALGQMPGPRPQAQHAMHQMLLQAMQNRSPLGAAQAGPEGGAMLGGATPGPTGTPLPLGSFGRAEDEIRRAQEEKQRLIEELFGTPTPTPVR